MLRYWLRFLPYTLVVWFAKRNAERLAVATLATDRPSKRAAFLFEGEVLLFVEKRRPWDDPA